MAHDDFRSLQRVSNPPNSEANTHFPSLILDSGEEAWRRTLEFFAASIRNPNTRHSYARAIFRFCRWCEQRGVSTLQDITPMIVAGYIEQLTRSRAAPTTKQALAAIRRLFDYLVTSQVIPVNPALSVRGPRHSVKKGKTPVLSGEEARRLLESIDVGTIGGLRDRALIGVMIFSFARVGAVISMNVEDCFLQRNRLWFRLHEKGGKRHDVPAHRQAELYVQAYIHEAAIRDDPKGPLFRTVSPQRGLLPQPN